MECPYVKDPRSPAIVDKLRYSGNVPVDDICKAFFFTTLLDELYLLTRDFGVVLPSSWNDSVYPEVQLDTCPVLGHSLGANHTVSNVTTTISAIREDASALLTSRANSTTSSLDATRCHGLSALAQCSMSNSVGKVVYNISCVMAVIDLVLKVCTTAYDPSEILIICYNREGWTY